MAAQKILIAEDDNHINQMLFELLEQNGYAPVSAYSGTEALLLWENAPAGGGFALVLLDLMLPGKSGEQVLTEIRSVSAIPVIVLTARSDKETTVQLLRLGADDYLAKPFDNRELLARIEVQLRRFQGAGGGIEPQGIRYKDIIIDEEGFDALINGQKAGLSKREYEILHLMMAHPKKVFTKNNLYETVWGGEFLGDDNTINVHISKLRAKLGALAPHEEYIETVWGIGFKMKE
jgi:DNA-binding response OmpR family regulator